MLAKLTALTVSVEFYLVSLPPVAWLWGPAGAAASMGVCQCMAVSTYMTCALKDLLSCPRPGPASSGARKAKAKAAALVAAGKADAQNDSSDFARSDAAGGAVAAGRGVTAGVEVLESAYRGEIEMGAPSMHTWCALLMPAYAAAVAAQLGALSPQRAAVLTAASVCWAAWVALSRLYLGVHTPVDLALGGACGAAALCLWRRIGLALMAAVSEPAVAAAAAAAARRGCWVSWLPQWPEGSSAALLGVGAAYVLALATYPAPLSHTTSYEYAVIFLGAAYGGLVGASGLLSPVPAALRNPSGPAGAAWLEAALGRPVPALLRHPVAVVLVGFVLVAAVKEGSKVVLCALLPRVLALAPPALRRLWQPPVHPAGCWQPEPPASAVATVTTGSALGPEAKLTAPPRQAASGGGGRGGRGGDWCARAGREGGVLLMKSARLAYDVDFLRKFINYGLTVYAVMEYRHVAAALLVTD